jgi:DNA-binding transcriptional ArsR family regulator
MNYEYDNSEDERRAQEESQGVNEIRKELEEVRKLKETLKKEIEGIRERESDRPRRRTHQSHRGPMHPRDIPRPSKPPIPPMFDLRPLTESLSDMMEGLGEKIEESLRGIEGIEAHVKVPKVYVRRARKGRSSKRSRRRDREIEKIPPARVARIISPLGSEERLKILDFLKEGGKSFNDIEIYTGKTGSSLTHHLTPLLDAGYVIKGEVRGTYYVTVEGRLSYRLAQWLTSQVERERVKTGNNGDSQVEVAFEDEASGSRASTDVEQDDSDDEGDE